MSDSNQGTLTENAVKNELLAHEVLAQWLKKAREQSGLSIEAVSQETKISRNYIVSLESGNLDALPGKVFGRGFVKNITKLLRTDAAEGLRLYDACWGGAITGASVAQEPTKKSEHGPSERVEAHKTPSVQARIKEPVNTKTEVAKRLVSTDFASAGEKPRVPRTGLSYRVKSIVTLPEWAVRSFMNQNIRLMVLAVIATCFVALVFGRWAVENIHKSKFAESGIVAKQEMVEPKIDSVAAVETAVNADGVVVAPEEQDVVVNKSADSAAIATAAPAVTPAVVAAAPVVAKAGEMISDAEDPLYLPTAPGVAFEQVLELKVSEDVEVRLTLDGKKIEKTWFEVKDYKFTFNDRAEINVTDASKIELMFNGKSLGELGGKGRKRKILFQAKASASDFPQ